MGCGGGEDGCNRSAAGLHKPVLYLPLAQAGERKSKLSLRVCVLCSLWSAVGGRLGCAGGGEGGCNRSAAGLHGLHGPPARMVTDGCVPTGHSSLASRLQQGSLEKKTSQPWLRPRERGTTWVEGARAPPNLPAAQIGPVADPRQARGARKRTTPFVRSRSSPPCTPRRTNANTRVPCAALRVRPPPRAPSTRTSRGPGEGSGRQHRGGAGRPPQEAAAGGGGRGSGGARSGPRVEGGGRPGLTSHCDAPDTSL